MARPYRTRRWSFADADPAACLALTAELGISPVTAQILVARGLTDPGAARTFLDAGLERLHSPLLLRDMDLAAKLLRDRVAARRPVLVYGDYDVDGVTGTAMLVHALRQLGVPVEYHIPNRFTEGYGLNAAAIRRLSAAGHDFILSVDTGTAAAAEAELARELGITLVVTDHHEPPPVLPAAAALVNPKRPDCAYPFKGLSGAGVAFKLVQTLLGDGAAQYLDIVALATVADLVPLTGENRILVRAGLEHLARTQRPGLAALKRVAGLEENGGVSAHQVAFALGPRINALGRMGDAAVGVQLLLTEDPAEAAALAARLDAENQARQAVQEEILAEAMAQLAALPAAEREYAAVLAAEGWHHGVVGIVAAKVVEAVHRPAVLLAIEGGEARGSARSIPGFHMYRALEESSDLLIKFGGHAMAAGMSLRAADVPQLRRRLNQLAREWLTEAELVPQLRVDAWVAPEQITPELAAELERLRPYGLGNPEPRLACRGMTVSGARAVGRDRTHLKLRLLAGGLGLDGIGFGLAGPGAPGAGGLAPGAAVDAVFLPEMNEWNGRARLQLRLDDLHPAAGQPSGALDAAGQPSEGLDAAALLAWDPLAGLDCPRPAARASAGGTAGAPAPRFEPLPQPQPAALPDSEEPVPPGGRAGAVAALARAAGPILVLVSSPWAVAPVAGQLREQLRPDHAVAAWLPGRPAPAGARVAVAAWGAAGPGEGAAGPGEGAAGPGWAAAVAWHPPFLAGQAAGLAPALYAAWEEHDWALAGAVLGWPYPDREVLVRLFRLLRDAGGTGTVDGLAAQLPGAGLEPVGPWNELRVRAGAAVLAELGVLALGDDGRMQIIDASRTGRGKMNLEASPRFRRGQAGRAALQAWRAIAAGVGRAFSARSGAGPAP